MTIQFKPVAREKPARNLAKTGVVAYFPAGRNGMFS
jgi:hypothetical protein